MSMDTFDAVGPFREDFIIDAVDSDYCIRVRMRGLAVVKLDTQGFVQRVGDVRLAKLGPFRVTLNEHGPLRTYYRVRNSAALVRRWWRHEPYYAMGAIYCNLEQLFAAVLFYHNKTAQVKAMAEGLRDAWMGVTGFYRIATTKRGEGDLERSLKANDRSPDPGNC